MPSTVSFPNITEYFARAIQSVLMFYSNPNVYVTYHGQRIFLPPCEIAYSIRRLSQPATTSAIILAGSRTMKQNVFKITDATQPGGFAYELRAETPRILYVRVPLNNGNENDALLRALRIWDTLFTIANIRYDIWKTLGVFLPILETTPNQIDDKQSVVLHGRFQCQIHVPFSRNAEINVAGIDYGIENALDLHTAGLTIAGFSGMPLPAEVIIPTASDTWPNLVD
jgi:hypothetical protein